MLIKDLSMAVMVAMSSISGLQRVLLPLDVISQCSGTLCAITRCVSSSVHGLYVYVSVYVYVCDGI